VLVLGFAFKRSAASHSRLETALAEHRRLCATDGCEPAVIVTGGETREEVGLEGVTEARFMRDYLVGHGVALEHVRLEESAKYTIQNGLFVRAILESLREEVGAQLSNVVLVTNAFHMPRSKAIFGYVLGSDGDGEFHLKCVEAPDGPADALVSETGLSAQEWAAREEQQLAPRYGIDVGCVGGREGGHRSVLADRVIAHVDLLHAVRMGNDGALRWFEASHMDVNEQVGRGGAGPLHYAVHQGNVNFVRKLLALGADANAVNHNGCTPLHFLPFATSLSTEEHKAIRTLLCNAGADATGLRGASGLWRGVLCADEVAAAVAATRRVAGGDCRDAGTLAVGAGGGTRLPTAGGLVRQTTQTAFDPIVYAEGGNSEEENCESERERVVVDYGVLHEAASAGDEAAVEGPSSSSSVATELQQRITIAYSR
jgi:hypothetical protein